MKHLPGKKHQPYVKIGHLRHFHVFYHYHQFKESSNICIVVAAHGGEEQPGMESKAPLFSCIPNIYFCCKYIIEVRKTPSLTSFYKLYLSDIEVKILINSRQFLMFFWMCPMLSFAWLTPSVFSKWKMLTLYTYWSSFTNMGSVVL